MTSLIARIALRYIIGMAVMWALISAEVGEEFVRDEKMQMAIEGFIGSVMVAAVEGWTFLARKWGWKT